MKLNHSCMLLSIVFASNVTIYFSGIAGPVSVASPYLVSAPDANQPQRGSLPVLHMILEAIHAGSGAKTTLYQIIIYYV